MCLNAVILFWAMFYIGDLHYSCVGLNAIPVEDRIF